MNINFDQPLGKLCQITGSGEWVPIFDVDEPEKVLDLRPQKREAAFQDVRVGRPLGRDQVGLGATCAGDEVPVFRPTGIYEVTVVPNDFEV